MYKYLLLLISFVFTCQLTAQSYNTAIGLRIGEDYGATIQQRLTKKVTLQGIYYGGFTNEDVHADLLVQRHFPIFTRRTNIFIGAGVGSHWLYNESDETFGQQRYTIPAIVGFEMSFKRLNLSADITPHFVFNDKKPSSFNRIAALSLRYILIKKKPGKKLVDKIEDKLEDLDVNNKKTT